MSSISIPPFLVKGARPLGLFLTAGIILFIAAQPFLLSKKKSQFALDQNLAQGEKRVHATLDQFPNLYRIRKKLEYQDTYLVRLREKVAKLRKQTLRESEIASLVERKDLMNLTLTPVAQEKFGAYTEGGWQVSFDASYNQAADYLNLLERSSPFLRLNSVQMAPNEQGTTEDLSVLVDLDMITRPG